MDVKRVLIASLAVIPAAVAGPTVSGAFVGLSVGGSHVSVKEYFREDGKKAKDQKEWLAASGNGFTIGGEIGGGYAISGVYIGARIIANWDATEAKEVTGSNNLSRSLLFKGGAEATSLNGSGTLIFKPRVTYGGALLLGGQIAQRAVVYLSVGVEFASSKIRQSFAFVNADNTKGLFLNSDFDTKYTYERASNFSGAAAAGSPVTVTPVKGEQISQTMISIVPGIGCKYILESGVYFGVDAGVGFGLNREIDAKHLTQKTSYSGVGAAPAAGGAAPQVTGDVPSIKDGGFTLHTKRDLYFRGGVSIGYKF